MGQSTTAKKINTPKTTNNQLLMTQSHSLYPLKQFDKSYTNQ